MELAQRSTTQHFSAAYAAVTKQIAHEAAIRKDIEMAKKLTKKQLEAQEREYAATQDKLDALDAKREAERDATDDEPFLPHPFVHVPGLSGPGEFPRFPDRDPVTGVRYENIVPGKNQKDK